MTLVPPSIRRARQAATALHERLGLHDIHRLDVDSLANRLGVRVRRGGLRGAAARLVGGPDFALVRLSSEIDHEGAQRFSFAHEIGHWHLQHRSDQLPCGNDNVSVDRGIEAEANAFASELLMPARVASPRCVRVPVTLHHVRSIASAFRVSLVAATMRFVELTDERCAVIFSRDGRVVWQAKSVAFTPYLRRGRTLSPESAAANATNSGSSRVPADAWFDHDGDPDIRIVEETAAVPVARGMLSLLWIPERTARRLGV